MASSAAPGFAFAEPLRVPIGWVDAAAHPATAELWLGGDVLCATFAARSIAEAVAGGAKAAPWQDGEVPVDGATVADLIEAARRARGADLPFGPR